MAASPIFKKPPVSQVLIEMALAAGQGIGNDGVTFDTEAGAFWNKHYKHSVRLALSVPKGDWTKDRKNVLRVAVLMGKFARREALKTKSKVIDKNIAEKASQQASSNKLCPAGGGRHCP